MKAVQSVASPAIVWAMQLPECSSGYGFVLTIIRHTSGEGNHVLRLFCDTVVMVACAWGATTELDCRIDGDASLHIFVSGLNKVLN